MGRLMKISEGFTPVLRNSPGRDLASLPSRPGPRSAAPAASPARTAFAAATGGILNACPILEPQLPLGHDRFASLQALLDHGVGTRARAGRDGPLFHGDVWLH